MSAKPTQRIELSKPAPLLPPAQAVVLGVAGDDETQDELSVLWTFILNGTPPQVGVSAVGKSIDGHKKQIAHDLIRKHGAFTLNMLEVSLITKFDIIDMSSSSIGDKFASSGLTRLPSKLVNAPGISEAAIVLECKVTQSHELPPGRTVFFADVVRTTVKPEIVDDDGRLAVESCSLFSMAAGSGTFHLIGRAVGRIGMTKNRTDILY